MILYRKILILMLLFVSATSTLSAAEQFHHSYPACANFLVNYIRGGWVDYKGIDRSSKDLDESVAELESLSVEQYESFNRTEKIAYLINAYNVFTIKAVMNNFPLKNTQDIPGFWRKSRFVVAGRSMSLDNIERDFLRAQFKDPRFHCVLTRASISAPLLWNRPFTPDSLEYQLSLRAREFLHDIKRNQIDLEKKEFKFSQIFDWYGNDFIPEFRRRKPLPGLSDKQTAIVYFALKYFDVSDRKAFLKGKISVSYLEYNWNLNIK